MKNASWTKIKSAADIPICEAVNIEAPSLPSRSWAYHLSPIGIETSSTESLASYFIRLSEVHFVKPRVFFTHGISGICDTADEAVNSYADRLVSPKDTRAVHQINGSGMVAEKWTHSLEELTQQTGLRFLTFLPWKDTLSNRTMRGHGRAWCPACLEDQRVAGIPIHEQLRWSHRLVLTCPDHKVRLEMECHHCKGRSEVLCGKSQPGLCSRCKGWLGHYPDTSSQSHTEHGPTNTAFEVFVAEQIGNLIAVAPSLACFPGREVPGLAIKKCVDLFFEGNLCAFARCFGMKKGVTSCFTKSKLRFIDLDLLSRVAFRANTTLLNLLTNENALTDFNPLTSSTIPIKRLSPRLRQESIYKTLLEALEEKPPPSLNEISERLGYSRAYIFRHYFPDLYEQVATNYLTYSQDKKREGWSVNRLQSKEVILKALEVALEKEPPPSLVQVAKSLGYASSQSLRPQFPDLCKALADKRRKIVSDRREMIEGELKQAIESDPPIHPNEISKKLGYKTNVVLRTMFPDECRAIRLRYEEHTKKQFLSKVEITLRLILNEIPPPPLNASLQRIGVSDGFLRKYFPAQHHAIAARYIEFRNQRSLNNKELERKKIKLIVSDLMKREIFPSMDLVLEHLPNIRLKYPEVWSTIIEAREEFARKT